MQNRKSGDISYRLIRARQKTMSLRVAEDGVPVVRAPYRLPLSEADRFVAGHRDWIESQRKRLAAVQAKKRTYTSEEEAAGRAAARRIFEEKCRYFAQRMGVTYNRISIREQKTRWGSCSSRGNLNFNWKLALMPEEIQDYLAVHELAHRLEMNHSDRFGLLVENEIPDYKERRRWLRQNGPGY